mgnify:CR=1 FL=1
MFGRGWILGIVGEILTDMQCSRNKEVMVSVEFFNQRRWL